MLLERYMNRHLFHCLFTSSFFFSATAAIFFCYLLSFCSAARCSYIFLNIWKCRWWSVLIIRLKESAPAFSAAPRRLQNAESMPTTTAEPSAATGRRPASIEEGSVARQLLNTSVRLGFLRKQKKKSIAKEQQLRFYLPLPNM